MDKLICKIFFFCCRLIQIFPLLNWTILHDKKIYAATRNTIQIKKIRIEFSTRFTAIAGHHFLHMKRFVRH